MFKKQDDEIMSTLSVTAEQIVNKDKMINNLPRKPYQLLRIDGKIDDQKDQHHVKLIGQD